ncbi:MAG: DUF1080 domain-containing protein [Planctomycetota bacterium]
MTWSQIRALIAVTIFFLPASASISQEWKSGMEWSEPPLVTPGDSNDAPPSDAIVLFDGSDLDSWENGEKWLIESGVAIPRETQITSRQKFGDMQLHLEWSSPTEIRGEGQGRGNSGCYLMGLYEVQILDSFENKTYFDGQAGSIYKQTPPLANAMRKPGEWNHYDIIFNAPKFRSNGDVVKPGYVTLIQNGVLLLNHFELEGPTSYTESPHYKPHPETGPITLQFHGDAVRFRNIWVREIKPPVGQRVSAPFNIPQKKKEETKKDETSKDDVGQDDPKKESRKKDKAGKAVDADGDPAKEVSDKSDRETGDATSSVPM